LTFDLPSQQLACWRLIAVRQILGQNHLPKRSGGQYIRTCPPAGRALRGRAEACWKVKGFRCKTQVTRYKVIESEERLPQDVHIFPVPIFERLGHVVEHRAVIAVQGGK